jgi:hypothetical protein
MYLSKIACEMFNELVADGGVPPVERLTPDVLSTEVPLFLLPAGLIPRFPWFLIVGGGRRFLSQVMSSVEAMDKDRGCVIECMREKLGIAAATSQHAAALVRPRARAPAPARQPARRMPRAARPAAVAC